MAINSLNYVATINVLIKFKLILLNNLKDTNPKQVQAREFPLINVAKKLRH